jgi:hypothetical protein
METALVLTAILIWGTLEQVFKSCIIMLIATCLMNLPLQTGYIKFAVSDKKIHLGINMRIITEFSVQWFEASTG